MVNSSFVLYLTGFLKRGFPPQNAKKTHKCACLRHRIFAFTTFALSTIGVYGKGAVSTCGARLKGADLPQDVSAQTPRQTTVTFPWGRERSCRFPPEPMNTRAASESICGLRRESQNHAVPQPVVGSDHETLERCGGSRRAWDRTCLPEQLDHAPVVRWRLGSTGVDFRERDGQALSDVLKDLVCIPIEQVTEHGTGSRKGSIATGQILFAHVRQIKIGQRSKSGLSLRLATSLADRLSRRRPDHKQAAGRAAEAWSRAQRGHAPHSTGPPLERHRQSPPPAVALNTSLQIAAVKRRTRFLKPFKPSPNVSDKSGSPSPNQQVSQLDESRINRWRPRRPIKRSLPHQTVGAPQSRHPLEQIDRDLICVVQGHAAGPVPHRISA